MRCAEFLAPTREQDALLDFTRRSVVTYTVLVIPRSASAGATLVSVSR